MEQLNQALGWIAPINRTPNFHLPQQQSFIEFQIEYDTEIYALA